MNNKFRITAIALMVAALGAAAWSQAKSIKIAVASFEILTAEADAERPGEAAAQLIESNLGSLKQFQLRKSGEIEGYVKKLELAQAGAANPDELKGAGEALKINYIAVGSISRFGALYQVDVRTVNVDDWSIVHSSGIDSYSIDSACRYVNKDIQITFTGEELAGKEKQGSDKTTVTVYAFDDSNVMAQGAGYGGAFAEMLNSELGALRKLSVIERTHSKALINEKALEMAGIIENNDADSYLRVRGIAYRLTGGIRVFKDVTCIAYELVSTETGAPALLGYTEIAGLDALRPVARHIARFVEEALNNRIGTLKLVTDPANAEVLIDGLPAGTAPVLTFLAKGAHQIKVSYRGYETAVKDVAVEPKTVNMIEVKLERLSRKLLDEALLLERMNNWEAAVAKYQEFIERYSETEEANEAYYRKGHVLQNYMAKYQDALAVFEALIKRYPDAMTRAEAYFGLAKTYTAMGNTAKARESLSILIEKFPDSFAAEEGRLMLGGR
jgi:TolB-like protein